MEKANKDWRGQICFFLKKGRLTKKLVRNQDTKMKIMKEESNGNFWKWWRGLIKIENNEGK